MPRQVEAVAEAVCDGHRIDWPAVERQTSDAERPALGHLRALVELTGAAGRDRSDIARPARPRIGWPWRLLLSLSAFQAVAALIGFVAIALDGSASFVRVLQVSTVATLLSAAGVLVVFGRDRRAVSLAGLLLVLASAPAQPLLRPVAGVPVVSWLLTGLHPDAWLAYFAWSFTRDFPQVVRFSRLDDLCLAAVRLTGIVAAVLFGVNFALTYWPALPAGPLVSLVRGDRSVYWAMVFGLMIPALAVMLGRLRQAAPDERRRVAFFLGSLAAGLLPVITIVSLEIASEAFDQFTRRPGWAAAVDAIIYVSVLSIPFTTAYAVVVRQVIDVRVLVRRTVRYALARQTLVVAAIVPVLLLGRWISGNRQLTIGEFLGGPQAATAAAFAAAAIGLLLVRARLTRYLDRKYFRIDVDLPDRLARITEDLGQARGPRQIGEEIARAIPAALQVGHADLLVRRGALLAPIHDSGTALPLSSALAALLAEAREPLDLGASALGPLLPDDDRRWIARNRAMVLVPVGDADLGAVLVVGARHSDEALSPQALSFLSTVAAAAALALGRLDAAGSAGDGARAGDPSRVPAAECVDCGTVAPADASRCRCGGTLRSAALPEVVAGKFRVERVLGRGGMGVVYRAADLGLGRQVALKTLPRLSAAAAARLRQEAQSMASVSHPALATIHGVESWQGAPILVIELLAGGTLADRLRHGALPIPFAVATAREIARCLAHLHRHGLLHRDVKPSNIGIDAHGQVKLLDFGLAQLLDPEEAGAGDPGRLAGPAGSDLVSRIAGTPAYLPPEALEGVKPAAAFDLWALGITLYEMITGRHPFSPAASLEDTLALVRRARVPDARSLRPDCPADLAALLARALARAPAARLADAEAFGSGL